MFFCKTQTKGNYIQKIHKGQFISSITQNQLALLTENSIEILSYEYDTILHQYTTSSLLSQSFPFQIIDSTIVSSKLLLLTKCGLVLLDYIEGSFIPIDTIALNGTCDPMYTVTYLKANKSGDIVVTYSNTNLFFIYMIKENKLISITTLRFGTSYNICNAFVIKLTSNSFGITFFTKNNKDCRLESFFFDLESKDIDCNIEVENFSAEIKNYVKMMTVLKEAIDQLDKDDIYDIVFSPMMKHVFLICDSGIVILNIVSSGEITKGDCIHFTKPRYYISSSTFQGSYIQLVFDRQIYVFEETNEDIKRVKLIDKENKRIIKGNNAMILLPESLTFLFYDYQSSIHFVQYSLGEDKNKPEFNVKVINEDVNQSMFTFDSAMIKKEEGNSIYSICGLKGNSRLVKYEDAFIETKLKELKVLNINNLLIASCGHSNQMKLFIFSYIDKASLYSIGADFSINHLRDFNDIIVSFYPIPSSSLSFPQDTFILVFKASVSILQLSFTKEEQGEADTNPLNSLRIKSEVSIPINSKQSIILSSSFYSYTNNKFYLICYLISNEILISSIDSKCNKILEEARINLGNTMTISSMTTLLYDNINQTISFIIGTYQSYLQLIYYDLNEKKFIVSKENKYDIIPDGSCEMIVPEDIETIDNYIFISTRTGEFCVLVYRNESRRMECLMSNKFTAEALCLKIANVEKTMNGYSLDLFNEVNAFNFTIDVQPHTKVYRKKYLIKTLCNDDSSDGYSKGEYYSEMNSIVFYKKMMIDHSTIFIYQNHSTLSFSYFPQLNNSNNTNRSMIINTLYNFPLIETAKRIISINNNHLLILTDANKLYLYSPQLFKCIFTHQLDSLENLSIYSLKSCIITHPNDSSSITCICLCGEYFDKSLNSKRGILFIYEYITDTQSLSIIAKIPKFPKPIFDVCCIKNYFVTGMEGYLCILPYEFDPRTNSLIIKKEAKQQQFLNKIISLYSINNNDSSNSLIAGDYRESFQLLDFESKTSRFDINAANMSNRALAKAIPINNSRAEVLLLEKNCCLTKFQLVDDLYTATNSVDMKEYINQCHQMDEVMYCTGLLGSLYVIRPFNSKMSEELGVSKKNIEDLAVFQKEVFRKVSMYYFNNEFPIEKMMMMSTTLHDVILLDLLDSICRNHKRVLMDVLQYEELVKLVSFLMEEIN